MSLWNIYQRQTLKRSWPTQLTTSQPHCVGHLGTSLQRCSAASSQRIPISWTSEQNENLQDVPTYHEIILLEIQHLVQCLFAEAGQIGPSDHSLSERLTKQLAAAAPGVRQGLTNRIVDVEAWRNRIGHTIVFWCFLHRPVSRYKHQEWISNRIWMVVPL